MVISELGVVVDSADGFEVSLVDDLTVGTLEKGQKDATYDGLLKCFAVGKVLDIVVEI